MRGRQSMSPLYKLGLVYIVDGKVHVTEIEFGIFVLSLKNYTDIDRIADELLDFRLKYSSFGTEEEQEQFRCEYVREHLSSFKNPEKNTLEYADNMIRYMRLTKYICIRGKYSHVYIDLEPRRLTEINSILHTDDGSAAQYTQEEWRNYMGTYGAYPLPFETVEKLREILANTDQEISTIERKLGMNATSSNHCATQDEYKREIERRREYRTELQNLEIKQEYHSSLQKIDEAIKALEDIRDHNKNASMRASMRYVK